MTSTQVTTSTRHAVIDSPLGELTLVRDDDAYLGLYFPHHWTRPDRARFGPRADADHSFAAAVAQLGEYFAGQRRAFDLPMEPRGTELARQVWTLLAQIPYGRTTTYGALAEQAGTTARDLGALVGQNPLSILVPCHRVVGTGGKLTGYAGGLDRKRKLLELEHAIPEPDPGLW